MRDVIPWRKAEHILSASLAVDSVEVALQGLVAAHVDKRIARQPRPALQQLRSQSAQRRFVQSISKSLDQDRTGGNLEGLARRLPLLDGPLLPRSPHGVAHPSGSLSQDDASASRTGQLSANGIRGLAL